MLVYTSQCCMFSLLGRLVSPIYTIIFFSLSLCSVYLLTAECLLTLMLPLTPTVKHKQLSRHTCLIWYLSVVYADSLMMQYGGAFALLQNMGKGPSSEKSHSSQVNSFPPTPS